MENDELTIRDTGPGDILEMGVIVDDLIIIKEDTAFKIVGSFDGEIVQICFECGSDNMPDDPDAKVCVGCIAGYEEDRADTLAESYQDSKEIFG